MAWSVSLSPSVQEQLDKLDKPIRQRILTFLYERVEKLDDPRQIGEALQGRLRQFWRYRVGDYRLICTLQHGRLVVLVLRIGHRREVYKG
jgi:mRNA interferase RelE/StbE